MSIDINGKTVETDDEGFLLNFREWDEGVARTLAQADFGELTPAHWEIIRFLRQHYEEYRMIPPMRLLTKAIEKRLGAEKGNSRYLYQLFPDGPVKQASRYAGLPKPPHCI